MFLKNRKLRLALIVLIAIGAALTVAYQNQGQRQPPPCKPGKQVEKDAAGTVTKITRTSCFD